MSEKTVIKETLNKVMDSCAPLGYCPDSGDRITRAPVNEGDMFANMTRVVEKNEFKERKADMKQFTKLKQEDILG